MFLNKSFLSLARGSASCVISVGVSPTLVWKPTNSTHEAEPRASGASNSVERIHEFSLQRSGKILAIFCFLILNAFLSSAQTKTDSSFFKPAEIFNKKRFWTLAGAGGAAYTGVSIGLWNAWYKNNEISAFHLFDDSGEWNQYDKAGHLMTAYAETYYSYKAARWVGLKKKKALWTAAGIGTGLQLTIEIMDGFSDKWGFSVSDVFANELGVAAFLGQEFGWGEQRIVFKVSVNRFPHSEELIPVFSREPASLKIRADQLFGTGVIETALKDYNEQKTWASVNVWSFLPERETSKFPKWLNVSFGYGVGNIYGGFENRWQTEDGAWVDVNSATPRYRQFLFSLDADLTKIKTKNRFLKTVLTSLNFIKIPFPTLEYNTLGKWKFHPIYW